MTLALGVGFISASKPYSFKLNFHHLRVRLTMISGFNIAIKLNNAHNKKKILIINNGAMLLSIFSPGLNYSLTLISVK